MTDPSGAVPTEQEISQTAAVLHRLQPGFLPLELFLEVTRLCATPIVELVPLRHKQGATEVLLFRRPADDPNWPNQLHTPGTVIRATDVGNGLAAPFARLYGDELCVKPSAEPVHAKTTLHTFNRGTEFAAVFYIDLADTTVPGAVWYPAGSLPEDLVATQRGFIAAAVDSFEKRRA